MILKILKSFFILIACILIVNFPVLAENEVKEEYLRAQVVNILEEGEKEISEEIKNKFQKLELKFLTGAEKDQIIEIEYGAGYDLKDSQKAKKNDTLVLVKNTIGDKSEYLIVDKYRLGNITFVFFIFFLSVILIAGLQGFTSMLGMLVSLLVILKFIVPQILAGRSPLLISILGSLIILVSSLYLAHGFKTKTHLAVLATFITLIITGILGILFTQMSLLTGLGSEEAYSLTLGQTGNINFKGLLLGGIIIGALGSLDDVTTSQIAAIFELHQLNENIKFEELIKRGIRIGREHVAGMVNTLILAYAGASLALFILFYLGAEGKPFWLILNSEVIAEEIVRSLAGSIGLVIAVPLSTLLASYYLKKKA